MLRVGGRRWQNVGLMCLVDKLCHGQMGGVHCLASLVKPPDLFVKVPGNLKVVSFFVVVLRCTRI